jgi:hypothetical protein
MKINFTKKEYRTLIEMLLVADWVISAHEDEKAEAKEPYRALRKKLLAHHREMGMAEAFSYSPEHDEYFETKAYEARAPHMQIIDAYDDAVFWERLVYRLAQRDLEAEETLRPEGPYEGEERVRRLFEIAAGYEDEFAENGLDNIRFVRDTPRMH